MVANKPFDGASTTDHERSSSVRKICSRGKPMMSATRRSRATTHGVAGNPSRFTTGAVPLKLDDAWREAMRPADRRLVTAITAPLAYHYRYLGAGARSRP